MYVNSLYNQKGLLVSNIPENNICQVDNKERIMIKDLLGSDVLKTIDTKLNQELNNIELKRIPINISFEATIGKESLLTISDGKNQTEIKGNIVEKASNSPISKERIEEQLVKLGSTPFKKNIIKINIDNDIFINIKEINELRRKATEELIKTREGKEKTSTYLEIPNIPAKTNIKPEISILVRTEDQLNIALRNNIQRIYTPSKELYEKYKNKGNIYLRLDRVIEHHKEYNNENLLCTEFGSIIKYNKNNNIVSDYYLNAANDFTINKFKKYNVKNITLSIELSIEQLIKIKNKDICEVIVYGLPENMIIKNNIFDIKNETTYLVDSKNNIYPITYDNFTHIFNHEPINIIDKISKLKGFKSYRIELFEENIAQTQTIINKVKNML